MNDWPPALRVGFWMCVTAIGFAVMLNSVRHLSDSGLHVMVVTFWRNVFAVVFFAPLIVRFWPGRFGAARWGAYSLRAIIMTISTVTLFLGAILLPVAEATALSFTAPLFTVVGAILFLREKVGWRRWSALIVGFCGILIMLRPGAEAFQTGALVVLVASITFAAVTLMGKVLASIGPATTTTPSALVAVGAPGYDEGSAQPRDRGAVARCLGRLGDPRLTATRRWVEIPASMFWRGAASDDPDAYENERPGARVRVDAFEFGRWPVTIAEFERFVDDGYGHRRYWPDERGWQDEGDLARAYLAWGGYAYGAGAEGRADFGDVVHGDPLCAHGAGDLGKGRVLQLHADVAVAERVRPVGVVGVVLDGERRVPLRPAGGPGVDGGQDRSAIRFGLRRSRESETGQADQSGHLQRHEEDSHGTSGRLGCVGKNAGEAEKRTPRGPSRPARA